MIIRAVKLEITTARGNFGFFVEFSRSLTIIRGNNSSGKSTLFNVLLYGLGMEELIGGRGEKALPYAVKDWFDFEGDKISIDSSEVHIEVENKHSKVVTFRRAIKNKDRSSKLVEIFDGDCLTRNAFPPKSMPTYLHDPGSAQKEEGFYRFLESFMGLTLPLVSTTTGGETKLYLQTIFAALIVEQKRGWSDYIANIPFFGIRDARTRVVEYLLGLNVFESRAMKNRLDAESSEIEIGWNGALRDIQRIVGGLGVAIEGVPAKVPASFDQSLVKVFKSYESEALDLVSYLQKLRTEYAALEDRATENNAETGDEARIGFDNAMRDLAKLTHLYETVSNTQTLHKVSVQDYQRLLAEAQEDLAKNKAAAKLRELGANSSLEIAADLCPTCHQSIDDSLLGGIVTGPQMDLATNINYLQRQCGMLEGQISGVEKEVVRGEVMINDLSVRISQKREQLNAIRTDVSAGASLSRASIRRQMQISDEVAKLERVDAELDGAIKALVGYSEKLKRNQLARKGLPPLIYSVNDEAKISLFEKNFRANAGSFGYGSAEISEIKIKYETLTPFLSDIELRQYGDIRSDSSASDFVRLIWSYLLSIYQTSSNPICKGNHPALLLLDEPGQHSMAQDSQRALLQQLSTQKGLQSIVAASFDESEAVFRATTANVEFKLIEWDGKSVHPL